MSSPRPIEESRGYLWQSIKTDIAYNQAVFIALYGVMVPATVLNAFLGGLEEHISRLMLVSVGLLGIIIGSEEIKTKRIRLPVLLPISIRQNGVMRFPVMSMYWASLMFMLWISSLISRQGDLNLAYFWFLLVKSALILIVVSCMGIGQDVSFCFIRRIPGDIFRILAKLCAVGAAFLYFFSTPFEDWPPDVTAALSKIFISPAGALGLLVFSFCLILLSAFVFEHRKSYTE
jgi:hypothetical protein